MNPLVYILVAVVLVVAIFLIFVATRPADFKITRSLSMHAAPQAVFEQINDFQNWRNWSPWERLDPNLQRTYEGPPAGVGSVYSWQGNKKVGAGRMTILESRPGERVRIKLEFFRPFKATNTAEFSIKTQFNETLVTWDMTGCNHFCAKLFSLVLNIDKLVGKDFEKGLNSMKSVVESRT